MPSMPSSNGLESLLLDMFEAMGNTLAQQYVGSVAHDKIASQRRGKKVNKVKVAMVLLSRYYNNTFTDDSKQRHIDLFLGEYIPPRSGSDSNPHLWEIDALNVHSNIDPWWKVAQVRQ